MAKFFRDFPKVSGSAYLWTENSAGSSLLKNEFFEFPPPSGVLDFFDLTAGSPVVGLITVSQTHGLSLVVLATDPPVIGTPTLFQVHNFGQINTLTGSPVIGIRALSQTHALLISALVSGAPAVGALTLSQVHALALQELATGNPVIGSRALSQVFNILVNGLGTGAPEVTPRALVQQIILVLQDLLAGNPEISEVTLFDFLQGSYSTNRLIGVPAEIRGVLVDKLRVPSQTALVANETRTQLTGKPEENRVAMIHTDNRQVTVQ